jgi:mRNA interferase RelE/StbE
MSYSIKWHPQAFKVLKKLPKNIIKRVLDKFGEIVKDPFRFVEHYEGQTLYKLRIGDYRALVDIDSEKSLILVRVFNHRSKIYSR